MKKILIVTDNLPDQVNGVVTTFTNIQALARGNGYDVVYLDPRQFPHCSAVGYPEVKISWPWGIGSKINEIDPDYVHIATEGPIGLAARVWMDWHGWAYNTSYHTKFPEFLNKLYQIPESWTYAYLRWFHKHSGRVLTTTETMRQELQAHGFDGNLVAWTRGVDRTYFSPSLRTGSNAKPVLLSVGRVSKEKGLDDFCELDMPWCHKIVVGDGPYRRELERRYPEVEFVGTKTGLELASYYAQADVFVFASRVDTFGVVNIEALACGTPVAAYPVPGPIDIVESGVTGYLDWNLAHAVERCMTLDRTQVEQASSRWTWAACWHIFRDNLVKTNRAQ
jgi:glycosyltransferase involved in cell wall biosynthesis